MFEAAYIELERNGELEARVDAAYRRMEACDLCPRRCGVDRTAPVLGACHTGREAIVQFLRRKWDRELDYRLIKEPWAFHDNRIAVR